MPDRLKTSLGIWALGRDGHPLRARRLPARARRGVDRREGPPRGRRPRRPDGRLRVPLPARAQPRQPRRGPRGARRPRHLLPGQRPAPRPALRQGRARPRPTTPSATRRCASRSTPCEFAGEIGAHFIIWPGIEGYNYPFQTPYARVVGALHRRRRPGRDRARRRTARKLFLEHKNSEPAMKIFMRNIGMTLHVIHKLRAEGIDNVQVNMDWQHLLMNGEHLPEYAALLAAEGLLGHQHANSGWGIVRRRQHGRRDRVHGDASSWRSSCAAPTTAPTASGWASTSTRTPRTRSRPSSARSSSGTSSTRSAQRIDGDALREAQQRKDAVAAYELVYAALGAPVAGMTRLRRPRRRHLVGQGHRDRRGRRRAGRRRARLPAVDAAARLERAGPRGLVARRGGGARRARRRQRGRHRAVGPDARPRRARRARRARCARRSCGTTGARRRSATRSRSASASSACVELTGNRALAGFTAPKLLWLREHEPEVYGRIAHILLPKDYVRLRLTDEHAIDVADASGTLLFDVAARGWSDEVVDALDDRPGVAAARLRVARTSTGVTHGGVPVAAGAGDQAAGALGVGVVAEGGPASVVLGTSGVVFAALDRYAHDPEARVHAFCHAVPQALARDGRDAVSAAGSLQWLRETVGGGTYDELLGGGGGVGAGRRGPALRALPGRRAHAARRPRRARRVRRARPAPRPRRAGARGARGRGLRRCATRSTSSRSSAGARASGASRAAARARSCGWRSSPRCSRCRSRRPSSTRAPPTARRCSAAWRPGVWGDAREAVDGVREGDAHDRAAAPSGSSPTPRRASASAGCTRRCARCRSGALTTVGRDLDEAAVGVAAVDRGHRAPRAGALHRADLDLDPARGQVGGDGASVVVGAAKRQVVAAGRRAAVRVNHSSLAGVDGAQVQLLLAEPQDRPAVAISRPHAEHAARTSRGRLEVGDVEDEVVDALDGEGHPRSLAGCEHPHGMSDQRDERHRDGHVHRRRIVDGHHDAPGRRCGRFAAGDAQHDRPRPGGGVRRPRRALDGRRVPRGLRLGARRRVVRPGHPARAHRARAPDPRPDRPERRRGRSTAATSCSAPPSTSPRG